MKMTKMALLAGAALAVTTAGAQADDLDAIKAQIEALNARVAAMETAPSVPAGYQLIAVSEGDLQQTPGLGMSARERAAYGKKSTLISILPTVNAASGSTISWSGFTRAALVYRDVSTDLDITIQDESGGGDTVLEPVAAPSGVDTLADDSNDLDVASRGQLRVKASTDTSVGEVGVDIRLRANFNGNGRADVYSDVAWGYWALTPELTLGGGYAGSLGNIGYGYDGACSCEYTDNADLALNPGDTTQLRLSYASGPISFAVALEDGSFAGDGGLDDASGDKLGVAGEIKYAGDAFSGEVSAVWRDQDVVFSNEPDELWQVGVGLGLSLGDAASLSLGVATGHGQFDDVANDWWSVTGLASVNLSDDIHAELGAGYKKREGEDPDGTLQGYDYETYGVLSGIYYSPVDQLTVGVEAEWYKVDFEQLNDPEGIAFTLTEFESVTTSVNLVTVWRF